MYNIFNYITAGDLATPIKGNLIEIEFALNENRASFGAPRFQVATLFDQARDTADSISFSTGNGSEAAWSGTGIALLEASASPVPDSVTQEILEITNLTTAFGSYGDYTIEKNTGDPLVFEQAFQSATELFGDAGVHALIFSNHGSSFYEGFNFDGPAHDNDAQQSSLQVVELAQSLQQLLGQVPLGLLAFDECLMANIETVYEIADVTRYVLAAEPTIPGEGYEYFDTLRQFTGLNESRSVADTSLGLGTTFVQNYELKYPAGQTEPRPDTLSLTDTSKLAALTEACEVFVQEFLALDDSYVRAFMVNLSVFGTRYELSYLQDLGMAALIARETTGASQGLKNAATDVIDHLNEAVLAKANGFNPAEGYQRFGHSGLTVTIPLNAETISIETFKSRAPAFEAATGWSALIERVQQVQNFIVPSDFYYGQTGTPNNHWAVIVGAENEELSALIDHQRLLLDSPFEQQVRYELDASLQDVLLKDLTIFLDVHVLNAGHLAIGIQGNDVDLNTSYAYDTAGVNERLTFSLADLNITDEEKDRLGNQTLKALQLDFILQASNGLGVVYDMNVIAQNNQFVADEPAIYTKEMPLLLGYSDIANFSLTPTDASYESYFELPVMPTISGNDTTEAGTTEVAFYVSPANDSTPYRFTVGLDGSEDEQLTFEATGRLVFQAALEGARTHFTSIQYLGELSDKPIDTAIGLSRSALASVAEQGPLQDYAQGQLSNALSTWGSIISGSVKQTTVLTTEGAQIRELNDLVEGSELAGKVRQWDLSTDGEQVLHKDGTLQSITSGLWFSEANTTIDIDVGGVAQSQSRLGFFEVTGESYEIRLDDGALIGPDDPGYLEAALANLADMVDLGSDLIVLKSGPRQESAQILFEEGKYYASVLLVQEAENQELALFSAAQANQDGSVQFVGFGDGFYGYEDLVRGTHANYDGDFNDVTFTLF